jgi:hypothetical protein
MGDPDQGGGADQQVQQSHGAYGQAGDGDGDTGQGEGSPRQQSRVGHLQCSGRGHQLE